MSIKAIAIFDIDGVIRDVGGSYRRALADTVEHFTQGRYRPSPTDIDQLKAEGSWNNDWEASQEFIYRYFEARGKAREAIALDFDAIVDFFQRRYRGPMLEDPAQWTGYITQEPLLVTPQYFEHLTEGDVAWGFFSGATRGSAKFILEQRLGLVEPLLIAMHDAPSKPDPTGFFQAAERLGGGADVPILYAGDTVADMQTVQRAKDQRPDGVWLGVGILPPHVVAAGAAYAAEYGDRLKAAGADMVVPQLTELTVTAITHLCEQA
ncbi:TIGR01548 family HAD-type hydrolase [Leptolyngbya iicbica]|uniref:TIGR01548 family HAD-type hydrolase n=2 Tax=Cyanophyceae TaxID=3028117 RepID=A0A4Q7EGK8_9CYAN|nr:TIGR01548 family HAD-type hydrolase [Leptolyngbya sp. LK]RZM82412.1 TIGR01548 family HAD-type hydrolase [Leptolyngbya sp. LK]